MSKNQKYILTVKDFEFETVANSKYEAEWLLDGIRLVRTNRLFSVKKDPLFCGLSIRGRRKTWEFDVVIESADLAKYARAGLKIDQIINTIPAWWVDLGLPVSWWCFLQNAHLVW